MTKKITKTHILIIYIATLVAFFVINDGILPAISTGHSDACFAELRNAENYEFGTILVNEEIIKYKQNALQELTLANNYLINWSISGNSDDYNNYLNHLNTSNQYTEQVEEYLTFSDFLLENATSHKASAKENWTSSRRIEGGLPLLRMTTYLITVALIPLSVDFENIKPIKLSFKNSKKKRKKKKTTLTDYSLLLYMVAITFEILGIIMIATIFAS